MDAVNIAFSCEHGRFETQFVTTGTAGYTRCNVPVKRQRSVICRLSIRHWHIGSVWSVGDMLV